MEKYTACRSLAVCNTDGGLGRGRIHPAALHVEEYLNFKSVWIKAG